MDIRSSTVMNEVKKIFNDSEKPVHFVWKAEFLVLGTRYEPMRTHNIEIMRDYTQDFAEDIEVELMVAPSQYVDFIYPNRDNLTVTLQQIPLYEDGTINWDLDRVSEVYRGYIVGAKDLKMNPSREQGTSEDMDMHGAIPLRIQLASKALEQLKILGVGIPVFRGCTPAQALRMAFDEASKRIKVDNAQIIDGVDMVPADNQNKREQIVIPNGMLLIELARYLQNKAGGIYNAGIQFFLQGSHWYIWPTHDCRRQEKTKKVLTIFDIPANQFPGAERTYRETPGQVIMLSTGKSANQDQSEALDLNMGNGIRFSDANAILKGFVATDGNNAVARRGAAVSEFVDSNRRSGIDFAPMAKDRITANPFKMASLLAPRKGMTMQFTWENANPFILYPGMPVKVYTLRDDTLEERTGVLIHSQYLVSPKGKTLRDSQQVCVAHLAVFVTAETVEDSLPDMV
jgi:hypothetical protein